VGLTEVVCGIVLALIPGRLKQWANTILLLIMIGAIYTHYALGDQIERMTPGLIFGLCLLLRLIITQRMTSLKQSTSSSSVPKKVSSDTEPSATMPDKVKSYTSKKID
jgi:uncharacterized membrane protein YphA (DoxX/SURF4 family)